MSLVPANQRSSDARFVSVRRCLVVAIVVFLSVGNAEARIIINEVNMGKDDYFEIYNYSMNPIDLTGYSAEIWDFKEDETAPDVIIGFPSLSLAANTLLTFHEKADTGAGEIDTPQIKIKHNRDVSIVIRDANGDIVDLWAHGDNFFGPPDADPGTIPINTIDTNSSATSYQRFLVQSGPDFTASDWGVAAESRNAFNVAQVVAVPEPTTWTLSLTGFAFLCLVWYRKRHNRALPPTGEETT